MQDETIHERKMKMNENWNTELKNIYQNKSKWIKAVELLRLAAGVVTK